MTAVLVTGGTGFVGSAAVRRLVESGREVHVLARRTSPREHLADLPLRFHEADLLDHASLRRAVGTFREAAGARRTEVVHAAAVVSYRTRDAELSRRANVEGTRAVLEACRIHDVDRVLHVSSVVAVGPARSAREELDEDSPFDGARLRVHYVTTKRAAEDFALAVSRQQDVVAVSPGAVFGASPRPSNTRRFLEAVASGRLLVAPPGSLGVVGLDDVAEGIVLALERGATGRRYVLVESSRRTVEVFRLAARALGVRPPLLAAPRALWALAAAGAELVDRARPLEVATPQALRMLGSHFRADASRARRELGWSPRPFEGVLAETVDDFRAARGAERARESPRSARESRRPPYD